MKNFLENDLEEIIYDSSLSELEDRGLYINKGKMFRQLKIGNYGRADLVSVSKRYCGPIYSDYINTYIDGNPYLLINIIELKQDKIGISALMQAIKYARGIQRYFENRSFNDYVFKITLIGSSIDDSGSMSFIPSLINSEVEDKSSFGNIVDIQYITYNYKIDGIRFKDEYGYKLVNEGF